MKYFNFQGQVILRFGKEHNIWQNSAVTMSWGNGATKKGIGGYYFNISIPVFLAVSTFD